MCAQALSPWVTRSRSPVTVSRDVIHFTAPLGMLGRLVTKAVLERYLTRLIAERNAYLRQLCTEVPGRGGDDNDS